MEFNKKNPPRTFQVGIKKEITIKDCGTIKLNNDEQVTFLTGTSAEYDVARKSWGFYATPSINGRLKNFGLRTALVKNKIGLYYIMIVEKDCEEDFFKYLEDESNEIITWLDCPDSISLKKFKNKNV